MIRSDPADNLLRDVYSVSTEAGHKLRYLITRARCDKKFAFSIGYDNHYLPCQLSVLFIFKYTVEGFDFWCGIADILEVRRSAN